MARTRNLYLPSASQPFTLSRSRLEKFMQCPRCFYLDRRLGLEPPSGPPFNINSAVDHLLKKEFDFFRRLQRPHPYMVNAGIDAVPFAHPQLDEWRENFKGIQHVHIESGFKVTGAIDDLWMHRPSGRLIVVDYKATAKDGEVTLDSDWQIGYKRQMELYQWLLRRIGYDVSETGYFVYCNGDRSAGSFGESVRFKVKLLPYLGDDSWVSGALLEAKRCLDADIPPKATAGCQQCVYADDLIKLFCK